MAPDEPRGREMPLLLYLLITSFVLMLLSGAMFMLGMPEALSRALFLATVIIWFALGIWTIVDGQQETRRIAAAQAMEKAKTKDEAKVEAKAEAKADAKADAKTETKVDAGANLDEDAPSPKSSPDAEDGLNDP
jgi:flagellar biosynthesis component FlhA